VSLLLSAGDDGVVYLYECLQAVSGSGGGGAGGRGAGVGDGGAAGVTPFAFGAATGFDSQRCRRFLRGNGAEVTEWA